MPRRGTVYRCHTCGLDLVLSPTNHQLTVAPIEPTPARNAGTPATPYILLVDDDSDSREMLAEYLTFRGFDVIGARSGETALTHARTRRPALVLMDLQMPGIGGWQATRELKAHPETKDLIVIALTAHVLTPAEAIARQAGCDGFIAKPFDIVAVGDAIAEVMRRGRAGLIAVDALRQPQGKPVKRRRSVRT